MLALFGDDGPVTGVSEAETVIEMARGKGLPLAVVRVLGAGLVAGRCMGDERPAGFGVAGERGCGGAVRVCAARSATEASSIEEATGMVRGLRNGDCSIT